MKSFIVFDILSASIRGSGSLSEREGILARRERACVFVSACLRAHQGAWQRPTVCSVIIESLAGVRRR